tara:strand:- start:672 stop:848 length:177 start_codon:yes stop_codon:yes gene_type:complete
MYIIPSPTPEVKNNIGKIQRNFKYTAEVKNTGQIKKGSKVLPLPPPIEYTIEVKYTVQ